MSTTHERRKILLVDRKTQLKYVGLITATSLALNVLVGFCIYFSVWTSLNTEYSKIAIAQKIQLAERMHSYHQVRLGQNAALSAASQDNLDAQAELLSDHLLGQLKESFSVAQTKLLPIVFLLLLVVIFEGIVLSNRIAGPIYHAEKSLLKIGAGDLTERTLFRKKDEFKGLMDKVNYVSEQWGYNIANIKKQLARISDSANNLKQSLGRYNPESAIQVGAQADLIIKKVAECNSVLARFAIPSSAQDRSNKEE